MGTIYNHLQDNFMYLKELGHTVRQNSWIVRMFECFLTQREETMGIEDSTKVNTKLVQSNLQEKRQNNDYILSYVQKMCHISTFTVQIINRTLIIHHNI